jgi:hypothetical protein
MRLLFSRLGVADAERFISGVKRDTFDYTEWRHAQWNDMTIEEIYAAAAQHAKGQQ